MFKINTEISDQRIKTSSLSCKKGFYGLRIVEILFFNNPLFINQYFARLINNKKNIWTIKKQWQ